MRAYLCGQDNRAPKKSETNYLHCPESRLTGKIFISFSLWTKRNTKNDFHLESDRVGRGGVGITVIIDDLNFQTKQLTRSRKDFQGKRDLMIINIVNVSTCFDEISTVFSEVFWSVIGLKLIEIIGLKVLSVLCWIPPISLLIQHLK